MYATTPVLFTALVALIHTAIAQPPPTCQPGETPHVSLDIPEWGQVISLDKNQHDEYQFWGHASTSFAFNVDQANPYTTEHFIYNVYDDTRGPWTQQYNEQIKIKHIYDMSAGHLITAAEGMKGECVGINLFTSGVQNISTAEGTPVTTSCTVTL